MTEVARLEGVLVAKGLAEYRRAMERAGESTDKARRSQEHLQRQWGLAAYAAEGAARRQAAAADRARTASVAAHRAAEQQAARVVAAQDRIRGAYASAEAATMRYARYGLAVVAAGATGLAVKSIQLSGRLEQSKIAFTTLLGSAQKAGAYLQKLKDFAASTPFEFVELQDQAKRLMAMGFQAKEVLPTLRILGDSVAALGGGGPMLDRVTLAFAQMRAKGKVSAQEMNQLAEAGIPGWEILSKAMGKPVGQLMKMAELGKAIPSTLAVPALLKGLDGRFHGLMSKQASTLLGLYSNLKDRIGYLMMDIGDRMTANLNIKGGLQGAINAMGSPEFHAKVMQITDTATDAAQALGHIAELAYENRAALMAAATGAVLFVGTLKTLSIAATVASTLRGLSGAATVAGASMGAAGAAGVAGGAGQAAAKLGLLRGAMGLVPFGPWGLAAAGAAGSMYGLKAVVELHRAAEERQRDTAMEAAVRLNAKRAVVDRARDAEAALERASQGVARAADEAGKGSDRYKAALDRRKTAARQAADADAALKAQEAAGSSAPVKAQTNSDIGKTRLELREVDDELRKLSGRGMVRIEQLAAVTRRWNPVIASSQREIAKLNKQYENGDISFGAYRRGIDGATRSIAEANGKIAEARGKMDSLNATIAKLRAQRANLMAALGIRELAAGVQPATASVLALARAIDSLPANKNVKVTTTMVTKVLGASAPTPLGPAFTQPNATGGAPTKANAAAGVGTGRGRGRGGRSVGYLGSSSTVDYLGNVGDAPTAADALTYADLSTGQAWTTGADGKAVANTAVQSFLQGRIAQNTSKLNKLVDTKPKLPGLIAAARKKVKDNGRAVTRLTNDLARLKAQLSRVPKGKAHDGKRRQLKNAIANKKALLKSATNKLKSSQKNLENLTGMKDTISDDILATAAEIDADTEALEAPETGSSSGVDAESQAEKDAAEYKQKLATYESTLRVANAGGNALGGSGSDLGYGTGSNALASAYGQAGGFGSMNVTIQSLTPPPPDYMRNLNGLIDKSMNRVAGGAVYSPIIVGP